MFDLVIRNGTVIDGSGNDAVHAAVAVRAGRIAMVGVVHERGAEEIDARGMLVTPGFVDIHTHYDGQVTWEERVEPSSAHGVTTVVMGKTMIVMVPSTKTRTWSITTSRPTAVEATTWVNLVIRASLTWSRPMGFPRTTPIHFSFMRPRPGGTPLTRWDSR